MRNRFFLLLWLAALLPCRAASAAEIKAASPQYLLYMGPYTGQKSKGIYAFRLDSKSGALTEFGLVAEIPSPSFLAIDPSQRFLYAANELDKFTGKSSGAVSSFSIDKQSGKLTLLNQQPSGGAGPCHVSVDRTGKVVLVANYGGGSIASFPVKPDGSLAEAASFIQHKGGSANPRRQEGPHAHCIAADPQNKFVLAADLGLDKLLVYRLNAVTGTLAENSPPFASVTPGAGPRHFAFTPDARYCYVINEINSTLTAFSFAASTGAMEELQTVPTIPNGPDPKNSTAEIEVHPSGRFVYGSNRGQDSIAVFAINSRDGKLKLVEHQPAGGKVPRSFGIDPTGSFLVAANQSSDSLVVFRIDASSGRLARTGPEIKVGAPVCVKFLSLN